jgi:hypothetical protein
MSYGGKTDAQILVTCATKHGATKEIAEKYA